MRIIRNDELRGVLYDKLRTYFSEQRQRGDDIHVSDLQYPRKAYWQRVHPLPPTDTEINYWFTGEAHHYILVRSTTAVHDSQEQSNFSEDYQLHYSPDLDRLNIEFKTSRYWRIPQSPQHYREATKFYHQQCLWYAVLKGLSAFTLAVLYLCPKDDNEYAVEPDLQVYDLSWSEKELADAAIDLKHARGQLDACLVDRDHTPLPCCPKSFCVKLQRDGSYKPVCKWLRNCQPEGIMNLPGIKEEG